MKSFENHNKFFVLILILKVSIAIEIGEVKEVECENVGDLLIVSVGIVDTCLMHNMSSINDTGVIISTRNEAMKGLYFGGNRKIFLLPVNVSESFPNLESYDANRCSLKKITKQNFEGLIELKRLYLDFNQIKNITNGTFQGLVALEILVLCQ